MMNIFYFWDPPLWKVVWANIAFWSKLVRPMGAIYYLSLYQIFGLNSLPYNVVRLLLLAINTAVFYQLANRMSRSWWIATLATLPVSYHAGLTFLAYRGSFIFDILCAGFYFATVLYYLRHRRAGVPLDVPQTCLFLALYICALNSKEMAVSLPVVLLVYEWLFHGAKARLVPVLIAGAITAIFIAGRTIGPGTLLEYEAYRPVFTWARFAESNTRFLNTLAYTDLFTIGRVLGLWGAILYFAARRWRLPGWDPRWMFWWVWVVVTPLPITFLPSRGGAMLYIPVAGWAMLAAMGLRALARRVARDRIFAVPRRVVMLIFLIASACLYAYETRVLQRDQVIVNLGKRAGTEAVFERPEWSRLPTSRT